MYLSDYLEAGQNELKVKYHAFFSVDKKDLLEEVQALKDKGVLKEGEKVSSLPYNLFVPSKFVEDYLKEFDQVFNQDVKKDLEENGIDKIIIRELYNYECFYTGDIDDALSALKPYEVTTDQVQKLYVKEYPTYCKHNE